MIIHNTRLTALVLLSLKDLYPELSEFPFSGSPIFKVSKKSNFGKNLPVVFGLRGFEAAYGFFAPIWNFNLSRILVGIGTFWIIFYLSSELSGLCTVEGSSFIS